MPLPTALMLVLASAPAPACEPGAVERCREQLLTEVNAERLEAGLDPLDVHPVLEAVARDRAREVAASGGVDPSMERLQSTTRRLYTERYIPHDWTESVLLGRWSGPIFRQWSEVQPHWFADVRAGDYEHVGIGVAQHGEQPVFALVFGLSKRTVDWRTAEPLEELSRVRREMLDAVNRFRREKGREELVSSPTLDRAAQAHAEDMIRRSYYAHRNPEGDTAGDRVRAAGYGRPLFVSENIAKGPFEPAETVERWMASSGHRANILRAKAREVGGGVAFGENDNGFEVVWVQVLASPRRSSREKKSGS